MDRFITKSRFFSPRFNTAIFSDPIRIYFSNEHESQALELYFLLQKRRNQWEHFLRQRGQDNYCYVMLYPEQKSYSEVFKDNNDPFSPAQMGDDVVIGINGPLKSGGVDILMDTLDQQIGYSKGA